MEYRNILKEMFIIVEEKDNRNSYRISNKYEKRINKLKTDSEFLNVIFLFVKFPILFLKELFKLIFDVILWVIKILLKLTCKVFKITEYSSSEDILNPRYMLIEDMEDYLKSNYLGKEFIKKDKIINDLVIFKSYRDELEINIRNENILNEFLSNTIAVFIGMLSLIIVSNKIAVVVILFFYIFFRSVLLAVTTGKKSDSSRLKTINKIIHTLEAIKENLVEVSDSNECDLKVSIAEEGTPPSVYFVNVSEILEDKINEDTDRRWKQVYRNKNKSVE